MNLDRAREWSYEVFLDFASCFLALRGSRCLVFFGSFPALAAGKVCFDAPASPVFATTVPIAEPIATAVVLKTLSASA